MLMKEVDREKWGRLWGRDAMDNGWRFGQVPSEEGEILAFTQVGNVEQASQGAVACPQTTIACT